ncbi:MAG: hypothetical protein F6K17_03015 [Okeania sp. SIO3C4]|nr:hypothetical protein [Okeania sp. SIO3B3]NER01666.1 hypothetical protein [Okeania sp. SIO3C4]
MKKNFKSYLQSLLLTTGGAVLAILILLTWDFAFDKHKASNYNDYKLESNEIEIKGNQNLGITQTESSTTKNDSKQVESNTAKTEGESALGFLFTGVGGAVLANLIPLIWNYVFDKHKASSSNTKASSSNTYESKNNQIEIKGSQNSGITQNGASTTKNDLKQAEGNDIKIEGDGNTGIVQDTIDK